jgi:hypothetical protein
MKPIQINVTPANRDLQGVVEIGNPVVAADE